MKRKLYLVAAISSLISMNSFAQYPTNGLVEYYSFNNTLSAEIGSIGSDFVATTPNFANANYNGSSHQVYSKAGVDNILMSNDNIVNFPIGNDDFTICFWIKIK